MKANFKGKIRGAFIILIIIFASQCVLCQQGTVTGSFPDKKNSKFYISYTLPGLGKKPVLDSGITDNKGNLKIAIAAGQRLLLNLYFDFTESIQLFSDTGSIELKKQLNKNSLSLSGMIAISPLNLHFNDYRMFIRKESNYADSIYNIRDNYLARKRRDSVKIIEPALNYADSLLFAKNLLYMKSPQSNDLIKAFVLYRRLMLKIPLAETKLMYKELSVDSKQSAYGEAVHNYLISQEGLKTGMKAPSFSRQSAPDGMLVKLEDFKGKYLLIDFWAAWCAPCRAESPEIIKLYNKYKEKNFEILGISLDRKKEDWLKAISHDKIPWKQASDLKFWENECVSLYGFYSIPFNFLVDPEGIIVGVNLHGEELKKKLEEIFQK